MKKRFLIALPTLLMGVGVDAQEACVDLFSRPILTVKTPVRVFTQAEQIAQLERNQTIEWLEFPPNANGHRKLWTISHLDSGIRMSLQKFVDAQENVMGVSLRPVDPAKEREFYNLAGRFFEPLIEDVRLPHRGWRFIYVTGAIQVKLISKHGLRAADVLAYMTRIPTGIRYESDISTDLSHSAGSFRFHFPVQHEGRTRDLVVVLATTRENDVLDMVTSYFKDGP